MDIRVDGDPAPRELLWRKNAALLIYLARSPRRRRTREHLRGLLWGSKPEQAARHSLNEAVRVIRRFAGDDVLFSEGEIVALSPDVVVLDIDELEQRTSEEDWNAGAQLVGGAFLEGFTVPESSAFEDWATVERATWLRRSLETLVNCAAWNLDRGELATARQAAERALALDARSDAAARTAMRVIALQGDRAGALTLFETFQGRLATELNLEPEAETVRLADRIRRERTWKLPAALVGPDTSTKRSPLVGRESELQVALRASEIALREGRCSVLFVVGDPGVGKTRLCEEILSRARLDGAVVLGIRAVPADMEIPWSDLLALGRSGLLEAPGLVVAPPSALRAFADELSEWRERFATEIDDAEPAPLGQAFGEILRTVAAEQPIAIFVDDAEWIDPRTAQVLAGAVRDLSDHGLLLLLATTAHTSRETLDTLRARIGREIAGDVISLSPLSDPALRDLARAALPEYEEDELDRLTRRVANDSAGLPLLAIELLASVRAGYDLGAEMQAWPEPHRTLDQTLPSDLPDAVMAAIRIGYRRLQPAAQEVLAAASVLGERVTTDMLVRVTGRPPDELELALDELEWERWLAAEARGYSFVAQLVRQVIAEDMLTPGQRERIRAAAPA